MRRLHFFATALAFILLVGLGACTTYPRQFAKMEPRDAAGIAPYAMMASNAYHRPKKRFLVEKLGWVQFDKNGKRTDKPTYSHTFSLAYDIFRNDRLRQYAFVFRGTDSKLDFVWANLAVGKSSEYGFAETEFAKFLRDRPQAYQKYSIVLVGHSLGGGMSLRESVVYGYDAFVFDPSPRLFGPPVPKFKPARRVVVFQTGEALAPLRSRTSAWYLATKAGDGKVFQVDFPFGPDVDSAHGWKKMVQLHDVTKLAEGIRAEGEAFRPELRATRMRPKRN